VIGVNESMLMEQVCCFMTATRPFRDAFEIATTEYFSANKTLRWLVLPCWPLRNRRGRKFWRLYVSFLGTLNWL
jgi:hypothetical protein